MMYKLILGLGSVFGFMAVAIGAFGAHALKDRLISLNTMSSFQTGVQYHLFHALALVAIGILYKLYPDSVLLHWSGCFFVAGLIVFSGSLYALSLSGIRIFGAITPIGGLGFLAGWFLLIIFAFTKA